jgi:hypothetical protein
MSISARKERRCLSPPIYHRSRSERFMQRLSSPRHPRPEGDGWMKSGRIMTDKTWHSYWCDQAKAFVYGPTGWRVQWWFRSIE